MLVKDPASRLTADGALNHPFFIEEMDIEFEQKGILR
jgi:hypothetical protein